MLRLDRTWNELFGLVEKDRFEESKKTAIRYYFSGDGTINDGDEEIGADPIGLLGLGGVSNESKEITAPNEAESYHFGACVDTVPNESQTDNNCSHAIEVTVTDDGGGTSVDYCRDDAVIHEGNGCEIYETGGFTFEVESTGRGCLRAGGLVSCSESQQSFQNVTINGIVITLVAARNDDDSWTIDDVEPEPN